MITEVSSLTKGGESLNLDLFDPWSSGIAVKEITGLGPVKTELSLERYALIDGAFLKGARVGTRNVVLTLIPVGDDVQTERRKIYNFFPVGETVTFGVVTNQVAVKSSMIVESVEPNIFSERQEIGVSLIAIDPYWRSNSPSITGLVGFNDVTPLFQFPFSSGYNPKELIFGDLSNASGKDINYLGDAETGVVITFSFNGNVSNLTVINQTYDEAMIINKVKDFYRGEQLVLDTRPAKKSVKHIAGGKESFITGVLDIKSQWIKLHPGINTIGLQFVGNPNDMDISIEYETLYRGV
jgi:hypothetical protein|nr:MAG TPA: tail protein [Caudoviricetes sp.]